MAHAMLPSPLTLSTRRFGPWPTRRGKALARSHQIADTYSCLGDFHGTHRAGHFYMFLEVSTRQPYCLHVLVHVSYV